MSVIILGGGPAGLALSIALAKRDIPVRVVESSRYDRYRAGEHLPPDGVMALLHLTSPVNWRQNYTACFGVESAWGDKEIKQVDYIKHPVNYGLNLYRPHFDRKLAEYAQEQGVEVFTGMSCQSASFIEDSWQLAMKGPDDEQIWDAAFVVDATGRRAAFARMLHKYPIHFDKLVAVAVNLTAKPGYEEERQTLLVETVENGWWYFVGLQEPESQQQLAVAVYMTDEDLMAKSRNRSWQTWKDAMRQTLHLRDKLNHYHRADNIHGFHVASQMLPSPRGVSWMAIGDAAIAFDPLSSQGMSKAFMSADSNAEIIGEYLDGNPRALDFYGNQLRHELMQYMQLRNAYYKTEQNWAGSEFWRRRQEVEETQVQAENSFQRIKTKFGFRKQKTKAE